MMEADKDQLITEDADVAYRKCPGVNNVAYVVSDTGEELAIIVTSTCGDTRLKRRFSADNVISFQVTSHCANSSITSH